MNDKMYTVYFKTTPAKLNTIVLALEGNWGEYGPGIKEILLREGFSRVADANLRQMQLPRERTLILTDCPALAEAFQRKGFACVGCAGQRQRFFEGAGLVLETPEAAEVSYLEEYLCHMQGEAVQVGETPRLILKEISADEIDELCAFSRQCDRRFLLAPEEEDFFGRERLLAYIKQVYRLYGYGLWSVRLKKETGEIKTAGKIKTMEAVKAAGAVKEAGETKMLGKAKMLGGAKEITGPLIGCCGFADVRGEDGTGRVELQYLLGEDYRRQGYGYEMCREALRLAQERIGCDRVWLRVHPENQPSLRLAKKLGFHPEEPAKSQGSGAATRPNSREMSLFSLWPAG